MSEESRKSVSASKKWGSLLIAALVFGLIAGAVMFGVNRIAGQIFGEPQNQNTASIPQTSTVQVISSDAVCSHHFHHVRGRDEKFLRRHSSI